MLKNKIINLHTKENKTPKEISSILNIHLSTVYKNLKGIKRHYKRGPLKLKVEPQILIYEYQSGKDIYQLAKKYSINPKTVWYHINKNSKTRSRGTTKNKKLNNNFFSTLNYESSYWIGFIFGDGNILGNRLSISLASRDRAHLLKLKSLLNIESNLKERSSLSTSYLKTKTICYQSTLAINSKEIAESLRKYNIKENKTKNGGYPNIPLYKSSCLLGLFDSDGCLSLSKGRWRISWYGHYDIILWVKNTLKTELDVTLNINTKKTIYTIGTSNKKHLFKIVKYLLKDNTQFLERKKILLNNMKKDLERSETRDARKQ